jgi:hypothetical protein
VQTELSYRYESFVGEITRQDNVLGAKLDGVYQLSDFAALGLGAGWTERSSADGQHPEIEYDDVKRPHPGDVHVLVRGQ